MTDKEVLEHILDVSDDFIKTLVKNMPHDLDVSKFANKASFHIAAILMAGGFERTNGPALTLVTGLVGCILRLKFNTQVTAMLKAEEAAND